MARGGHGAKVSASMGKSKTHGTRGGAKEHIPGGGRKVSHKGGKMPGGRGTRHGHGGGMYKKHRG
jgi:hypothetical protein